MEFSKSISTKYNPKNEVGFFTGSPKVSEYGGPTCVHAKRQETHPYGQDEYWESRIKILKRCRG